MYNAQPFIWSFTSLLYLDQNKLYITTLFASQQVLDHNFIWVTTIFTPLYLDHTKFYIITLVGSKQVLHHHVYCICWRRWWFGVLSFSTLQSFRCTEAYLQWPSICSHLHMLHNFDISVFLWNSESFDERGEWGVINNKRLKSVLMNLTPTFM